MKITITHCILPVLLVFCLKPVSSSAFFSTGFTKKAKTEALLSIPEISFQLASASVAEATTIVDGCMGYTDYTFNMNISNSPTGTAIITLGIAGGGTATAGVDFIITSNNNFAPPGMDLSFVTGTTNAQVFTIRVFDDAAFEGPETVILNYTISGATNAVTGSTNQIFTLTINDNDFAPIPDAFFASPIIGSFTNSTIGGQTCFYGSKSRHKIQYLVSKAELESAGITGATTLLNLKFKVAVKNSTQPYSNFTVSLANTPINSFSNFISPAFTQVYSGNYSTVQGFNVIEFSNGFNWNGVGNILISICFQSPSATAGDDILETGIPDASKYTSVFANYSSGTTEGCSLPAAYIVCLRPNLAFGYVVPGTPVSTSQFSSKIAYLGPLAEVYFYDGSGKILARIKNLSSFDYGCTQVSVDRDGLSTVPFWNNNPANYLASKTFRVVPANNTPSGNYQISLYYTAAEINSWASATGNTLASAQVVNVNNGKYVSDVTPTTNHITDVRISALTTTAFGSGYIATANFSNTGFSGFGIGVVGAALPITINYFKGSKIEAGHLLHWKVNCINTPSASMMLERSADGRNFSKINTITADAAACSQPFSYTDASPLKGANYYRLKAADADGKISYSSVVVLQHADKGFTLVSIAPNPVVSNNFKLHINSGSVSIIEVRILDMKGRQVNRQLVSLMAGYNSIPMQAGNLAAGTYTIEVGKPDEKPTVLRFVKQ